MAETVSFFHLKVQQLKFRGKCPMRRYSLLVLLVVLSSGLAQAETTFKIEATGGVSYIDTSIESRDFLVRDNESSTQGAWGADAALPTVGAGFRGRVDNLILEGSILFAGFGSDTDTQFFLNGVAGDFDEENVGTVNYDFDTDLQRFDAKLAVGYRYLRDVRVRLGGKLAVTEIDRNGDFTPLEVGGGIDRSNVSSTLRLIEYGPSLNLGFFFGDRDDDTKFWVDGSVSYLLSGLDIDFDDIQQLDVDSDGTTLGLGLTLGVEHALTESSIKLSVDGEVYDGRQDDEGPDLRTSILRLRAGYVF